MYAAVGRTRLERLNLNGQGNVHTYSVDYKDNDKNFKAHDFQPNSDAPWIERMTAHLGTIHHPVQFDTPELIEALKAATFARDLPGMADVDASLLLFCHEIKKDATVAISMVSPRGGAKRRHVPMVAGVRDAGRPARSRCSGVDQAA
jgi:asparagine synthetase B (glutamine-hydrolysing)